MLVCLAWVFRVCGTVLGAGSRGRVRSRDSAVGKGEGLGQKARWSYRCGKHLRCVGVRWSGAEPCVGCSGTATELCGVLSKKRTIMVMMLQVRPQVTTALQPSRWDPLVGQDDH